MAMTDQYSPTGSVLSMDKARAGEEDMEFLRRYPRIPQNIVNRETLKSQISQEPSHFLSPESSPTSSSGNTFRLSLVGGDRGAPEVPEKASSKEQNLSYTAMLAQAILQSPTRRLTLGEIYEYIEKNFPEHRLKVKGWKNCVRHNLSFNECFIKLGRSPNGRGNDWTIHPSYLHSFLTGVYHRKKTSRRRIREDRVYPQFVPQDPHMPTLGYLSSYATQHFDVSSERRTTGAPYHSSSAFHSCRPSQNSSPPIERRPHPNQFCPCNAVSHGHKVLSRPVLHSNLSSMTRLSP